MKGARISSEKRGAGGGGVDEARELFFSSRDRCWETRPACHFASGRGNDRPGTNTYALLSPGRLTSLPFAIPRVLFPFDIRGLKDKLRFHVGQRRKFFLVLQSIRLQKIAMNFTRLCSAILSHYDIEIGNRHLKCELL